ncbi:hypothetical protein F5884DRAFT_861799 [Xylogone sp. PMI_703]|nr:hypothetical protein F5884DRAFT_861799 [Xylogone sp. PMI_703]
MASLIGALYIIGYTMYRLLYSVQLQQENTVNAPVSVNYHFSRKCNYECGFCFHTEKSSSILPLDKAKRGMRLLKESGMKKLNFAGGEPFLYPKFLHNLLRYGKEELGIESISIVSNGSKITEKFLRENATFIDILAISCDSFDPETNIKIGRGKNGENIEQLIKVAGWCRQFGIKFKINTVVCSLNWNEDMIQSITQLQPFRWKVFQCLIVTGENDNEQRKRDARLFLVSDEQWKTFCNRHKHLKCFVPESNEMMKSSYLILDEYMRFLDKGDGEEKASESILNVGVERAMSQVKWERSAFVKRGGFYDWTKAGQVGCSSSKTNMKDLEW